MKAFFSFACILAWLSGMYKNMFSVHSDSIPFQSLSFQIRCREFSYFVPIAYIMESNASKLRHGIFISFLPHCFLGFFIQFKWHLRCHLLHLLLCVCLRLLWLNVHCSFNIRYSVFHSHHHHFNIPFCEYCTREL